MRRARYIVIIIFIILYGLVAIYIENYKFIHSNGESYLYKDVYEQIKSERMIQ